MSTIEKQRKTAIFEAIPPNILAACGNGCKNLATWSMSFEDPTTGQKRKRVMCDKHVEKAKQLYSDPTPRGTPKRTPDRRNRTHYTKSATSKKS